MAAPMHADAIKHLLLGALLLASAAAHAQYAWIDEKGLRHYSDQPPPTNTPDARVLKAPRGSAPALPSPAPSSPAPPAPAVPVKAAPTLAEREADYRQRHAADEKAGRTAAADAKTAEAKRIACAAAARNKAELETGRRLRREPALGNAVMTEADKAKELAQSVAVLKDCQPAP